MGWGRGPGRIKSMGEEGERGGEERGGTVCSLKRLSWATVACHATIYYQPPLYH